MRFADKKKDNIKILGYRKLQHKDDALYNDSIDFKCSWRTNRKVTYTRCYQPQVGDESTWAGNNYSFVTMDQPGGGVVDMTDVQNQMGELGGDIAQYLPLNSYLPFCLLYCPQFASVSPSSVTIEYNDVSYFNTN